MAAHDEVHPNQMMTWKTQALENLVSIFGGPAMSEDSRDRIREVQDRSAN